MKSAHIALYDYRDKITNLKSENDNLLIKQGENSRAIKDLLALNNSVEQHVHFSEGVACEKMTSYAMTSTGANIHQRNKENISGTINLAGQVNNRAVPNRHVNGCVKTEEPPQVDHKFRTPNIIRTVYLENSDISELRQELESIQNEIIEEKSLFDLELTKARNEKAELDEYARQEFLSDTNKIEKFMKDIEEMDQLSVDTLYDYGQLIKDNDSRIREKEEENEQIRIKNTSIAHEIKKVQKKSEKQLEHAEKEYEKATKEYGDRFKQQSDVQSEYIDIIKEQYDKIQEIYRNKNDLLITNIDKAKVKCKKTEARRSLELGGYYEDLKLLSKKCNFYENYTNKLKMLVEEDAKKMLERLRQENQENNQQDMDEYEQDDDQQPEVHYGDDDAQNEPNFGQMQQDYMNDAPEHDQN